MIGLLLAYFQQGYRIQTIDGERWRLTRGSSVVWVEIPAGWILP